MGFFERFMRGRYGADALSVTLLVLSLAFSVLCAVFDIWWLSFLPVLPVLFVIFRILSKNIPAREAENRRLTGIFEPIKRKREFAKIKERDRDTHVYFSCPACKKNLRLPKGAGKIKVTCPFCGNSYTKIT